MIPIKINPFICGHFVGIWLYCRVGDKEYSINTVKYEYLTSLFFKVIGFSLSLLFHTFSPLFHPFLFSSVPLGTTTNTFLPFCWQRDLALSYTRPKNPSLNLFQPFQLEDELAARVSTEANLFRLHLKCLLYNYSCYLNFCSTAQVCFVPYFR